MSIFFVVDRKPCIILTLVDFTLKKSAIFFITSLLAFPFTGGEFIDISISLFELSKTNLSKELNLILTV